VSSRRFVPGPRCFVVLPFLRPKSRQGSLRDPKNPPRPNQDFQLLVFFNITRTPNLFLLAPLVEYTTCPSVGRCLSLLLIKKTVFFNPQQELRSEPRGPISVFAGAGRSIFSGPRYEESPPNCLVRLSPSVSLEKFFLFCGFSPSFRNQSRFFKVALLLV